MHNIYSYKKPIEFVDFWPLKSTYNYLLRPHTRFYTPLVKSVRLSHMPQFQFAQIFNNFPDNFKLIMERTDFINHLEEFYHDRYKSSTCNKTLCKFCAFIRWKSYKSKYVCSPKTFSYVKCTIKSLVFNLISFYVSMLQFKALPFYLTYPSMYEYVTYDIFFKMQKNISYH